MKMIKPSEISARILTLIDESDERVIIVSPYMKILKWYKLINRIKALRDRGIPIEIYVRDDPDNKVTFHDLDHLGLKYRKIPHLHSKFYMNEKYGIVTSMNLLLSSEINSLEMGYCSENWEDYKDLIGYFHRYINIGQPIQSRTIAAQPVKDLKEFINNIIAGFEQRIEKTWTWNTGNTIQVSTGWNSYSISIKDDSLRITAYLRVDSRTKQISIQDAGLIEKKVSDLTAMKVDAYPDPRSAILQLSGQAQRTLRSPCIAGILEAESEFIMISVQKFINVTDKLRMQ